MSQTEQSPLLGAPFDSCICLFAFFANVFFDQDGSKTPAAQVGVLNVNFRFLLSLIVFAVSTAEVFSQDCSSSHQLVFKQKKSKRRLKAPLPPPDMLSISSFTVRRLFQTHLFSILSFPRKFHSSSPSDAAQHFPHIPFNVSLIHRGVTPVTQQTPQRNGSGKPAVEFPTNGKKRGDFSSESRRTANVRSHDGKVTSVA